MAKNKDVNIIDLLLNSNLEQMERPTKVVEITRLSKILGQPFKVLCKGLTYDKYAEIQEECITIGQNTNVDIEKMQLKLVLNGVYTEEGGKLFQNKDLQKKFNVPVAPELAKKLLLNGEINNLGDIVSELTGYGEGTVKEIEGL